MIVQRLPSEGGGFAVDTDALVERLNDMALRWRGEADRTLFRVSLPGGDTAIASHGANCRVSALREAALDVERLISELRG